MEILKVEMIFNRTRGSHHIWIVLPELSWQVGRRTCKCLEKDLKKKKSLKVEIKKEAIQNRGRSRHVLRNTAYFWPLLKTQMVPQRTTTTKKNKERIILQKQHKKLYCSHIGIKNTSQKTAVFFNCWLKKK